MRPNVMPRPSTRFIFTFVWTDVLIVLILIGLLGVNAQGEIEGGNVTEADYYSSAFQGGFAPHGFRTGAATSTHSCYYVRPVPQHLRSADVIKPMGVSFHYQKYTEAYDIPVLASAAVPDDAIRRACYILRILLAGNSAVRQAFYRHSGRVAVIGLNEGTTTIPEHSHLPAWWNLRARGLGATSHHPVSSGGEENLLCYRDDRYRAQDIFLHESAHGVHLLGAANGIPGWDARLRSLYNEAKVQGLWANTYSMSSPEEYFAEGVQTYFDVNSFSPVADGVQGPINTRAKLKTYDSKLFDLIKEVFPCDNLYLKRCFSNRFLEMAQPIKMDCDAAAGGGGGGGGGGGEGPAPVDCRDTNRYCSYWARQNECTKRPDYMSLNCKFSCNKCGPVMCTDKHQHCGAWAASGECQTRPAYMNENCMESCELC